MPEMKLIPRPACPSVALAKEDKGRGQGRVSFPACPSEDFV